MRNSKLLTVFSLGTLTLSVPEFVNLDYDLENRLISLTVEDSNVKQQKEIWGTFSCLAQCVNDCVSCRKGGC
jgi:ribosomal protein L6P/L9E